MLMIEIFDTCVRNIDDLKEIGNLWSSVSDELNVLRKYEVGALSDIECNGNLSEWLSGWQVANIGGLR